MNKEELNEEEIVYFSCNDHFLNSMNEACDENEKVEVKLLENLEEEPSQLKLKLALSSDMPLIELKEYLQKLEDAKYLTIDQVEYQKTKTDLIGFKCMLQISLDEIQTMFSSSSSNLALFLIKTLKFCTQKQKSEALKQCFEVIKIKNNIISFYIFSFVYSNIQHSSMISLFNIKKERVIFEKFSSTITTSYEKIQKFETKHSDHKSLKDIRADFLSFDQGIKT